MQLLLRLLISLALIVPFVYWIGGQHFVDTLLRLQTGYLGIIFVLYCASLLLRGWRFRVAQESRVCGPDLPYILIAALHNAANQVMPFRSGEFAFPLLARRYLGRSMSYSTASLLLIRFVELLVLVGLVMLGLLFVLGDAAGTAERVLILLCMFVLMLLAWKFLPRLLQLAHLVLGSLAGSREGKLHALIHKLAGIMNSVSEELERDKEIAVQLQILALTLANWLVLIGVCWCVLLSLGMHVSYAETIVGSSVSSVAQFIPLGSFGNVGPMEAGWTLGFVLVGLDARAALNAGFILHMLMIAFSLLMAGLTWLVFTARTKMLAARCGR